MPGPPAWFEREERPARPSMRWASASAGRSTIDIPVRAFLVEHPGAGPMLIDTGLHPSVAVDPKQNLGRISRSYFRDSR